MNSFDSNTLTFVISIWVDSEDVLTHKGEVTWRGEIKNIMKSESKRFAFDSLSEILTHIRPFLEARGVQDSSLL